MKESCGRRDAVRCYDMTVSSRTEHTQHPAYDRKQRAGVRVPFACLTLKLVIQELVPSFWTSQISLKSFSQPPTRKRNANMQYRSTYVNPHTSKSALRSGEILKGWILFTSSSRCDILVASWKNTPIVLQKFENDWPQSFCIWYRVVVMGEKR